jgi:hypothetical protein
LTTPVVVLVWLAVLLAIAALVSVMAGFIWCALHPLVIEEWIGRDEERRLFERDMIIAQYRRGPTLATGPGKSLGKFSSTKRPAPRAALIGNLGISTIRLRVVVGDASRGSWVWTP